MPSYSIDDVDHPPRILHAKNFYISKQCHIILRAIATFAPFSPDCGAPLPALSLELFLELYCIMEKSGRSRPPPIRFNRQANSQRAIFAFVPSGFLLQN
jgi:hypothetical protein